MPHRSRLRVCLVDMNNGFANQATRCFRRLVDSFTAQVREKNPTLDVAFKHVQPRNLNELPDHDTDLVLASGGPGAPTDGYDDPWCTGYRKFLDHIVDRNLATPATAPQMFVVCHSFELATLHFAVAKMEKRASCKFGLMPAYMTPEGAQTEWLSPFGYRIFAFEHRNWEAIDVDTTRLASLGGAVLANETHTGGVDKGKAILAMRFAPGIGGTQFHPEADAPGVLDWVERPESKAALAEAYGVFLLERMQKSLKDPERLAKTYALCIPRWLSFRFNELARDRGWNEISPPEQVDLAAWRAVG